MHIIHSVNCITQNSIEVTDFYGSTTTQHYLGKVVSVVELTRYHMICRARHNLGEGKNVPTLQVGTGQAILWEHQYVSTLHEAEKKNK